MRRKKASVRSGMLLRLLVLLYLPYLILDFIVISLQIFK